MRSVILILWIVAVVYAVFFIVPPAEGLGNLVRIAFLHIPLDWVSVIAFFVSAFRSGQYLRNRNITYDMQAAAAIELGLVFCLLATVSGAVFAKLTWGAYWNWDPRQTTIFILLLIYGAYLALRSSVDEEERRAKRAAVYALLSFVTVPFLVFVIPRYYFSLHPEPVINAAGRLEMDQVMFVVLLAAVGAVTALFLQLHHYAVAFRRKKREQLIAEYEKELSQS